MHDDFNDKMLAFVAQDIIRELYDAARKDPKIMVCDWRAYAVLRAYRECAVSFGIFLAEQSIEELFSMRGIPVEVSANYLWTRLGEWHTLHHLEYLRLGERVYGAYLDADKLRLPSYTLGL